jgi:uncharacterized repeat protein (TIGR03803 family)
MAGAYWRACSRAVVLCCLVSPALAQTPTTLYTFPNYTNGWFPRGGLAMDSTGALYGTTQYGGVYPGNTCASGSALVPPCGTIYKLTPPPPGQTGWTYQLLHSMLPAPIQGFNEDGERPVAPLTNFRDVLYGVNSVAGDTQCGCGNVFSITPSGSYTILHVFDPFVPGAMGINQWPMGSTPIGGLLISPGGTIYGTTSSGGTGQPGSDGTNGAGIIFQMNLDGSGFTKLHDFDGSLNAGPQGMMIFGQDGAIYGTQYGGGTFNQGVVFRIDTSGNYSVLYNFKGINQPGNSKDGANPNGRLALGPDGTIYGTTEFGGSASSFGTAWSIKQVNGSWQYAQLYIFGSGPAGSTPNSGLVFGRDGNLYGTTSGGGQNGGGVIYKLAPAAGGQWTYQTLFNFIPRSSTGDTPTADLLYANGILYGANIGGGDVADCPQSPGGCGNVFQFNPQPPSSLVSAVLPASRSVQVGATATAFATIINTAATSAAGCSIAPATTLPATFVYQTTNPATNALTGSPNTPVTIPGNNGAQSFVIALKPSAAFAPLAATFNFACTNIAPAPVVIGLNTLLLSASTTPTPDVVALGATTQNDGIVHVTGSPKAGAFAVASVNLGSSSTITVAANTGTAALPLTITLCQTNPQSGQCLQTPSTTVATTIGTNATPTFAIFVLASATVPFDPADSRVFVTFTDSTGAIRGETSVAVETQ